MIRQIEYIDVENIEVGERMRSNVDPARVATLAESIRQIGLQTPITVRTVPEMMIDGVKTLGVPVLVTGYHRLEALKSLGIERAPCIDIGCDEIAAEMWEIAENLHRSELTALERAEHITRWMELEKLRQPDAVSAGGRGKVGGTRAAARGLNISEPAARRANTLASLADDAKEAAKEVGLSDNQTALLEAAKAEPAQQAAVIRSYAEKREADRNKLDSDLQARAAKEIANILAEHVPGEWWDAVKANLYAAKDARRIANEFTNITGQSIMDRRYGS